MPIIIKKECAIKTAEAIVCDLQNQGLSENFEEIDPDTKEYWSEIIIDKLEL